LKLTKCAPILGLPEIGFFILAHGEPRMSRLILVNTELALETRRKSAVSNRLNREAPYDGMKLAVEQHKRDYVAAVHRPVGPCNTYNCHGLTFGARRTWIHEPSEIQKILEEDDYIEVPLDKVMAGDIAVYRKEGVIEHSGIVVEKPGLLPRILSKWGNLHEAIHFPLDCPYKDMLVTYYRVSQ
jgi:hypothetical protein